jgi:putative tryptophan/tyrosine transport system substrate-binding protein
MRYAFVFAALVTAVIILSFAGQTGAAVCEIVVVQSSEIRPFQEALEGFEETSGCSIKEVIAVQPGIPDLSSIVRRLRPDAILALGLDAVIRLQQIRDIPVFFTMAANLPDNVRSADNISGVSMIVEPERQIEALKLILPNIRRVGVIFNAANSGIFVDRFIQSGRKNHLEIIAVRAKNPQDVSHLLSELKGRADAIVMLPDLALITQETVNAMLLFSFNHSIPLVSFSEKFAGMGALAAIAIIPRDLGRQTGEMVREYFRGRIASKNLSNYANRRSYARKSEIFINWTVARKLGISLRDDLLKKSIKVE